MDTFLKLNRQKLKPAFIRISLIFFGAVLIPLTITYMAGTVPNGQFLLSILIVACVGFPIFIMLLGYLIWQLNHKVRQKVFTTTPFDQVDKIGFYRTHIGDTSKFSFTDEIKEGKLNGFTLKMDLSKEKGRRFIEFDIPVEWKKLDRIEFSRLTEKLKQYNAEFRIGSIVKQYDTRQHTLQTISDLKQDLDRLTAILQQAGFEAKS
jgi:hypothetical protein